MTYFKRYYESKAGKLGIILLFFTCLLTNIVFITNNFRQDESLIIIERVYFYLTSLGYAFILSLILYLVCYLPLSLIFKRYQYAASLYLLCAIIMQALLVIDSIVFSLYDYHLNISIVELFFKAGTDVFVFDMAMRVQLISMLFLFAVVPYLLLLLFANKLLAISDNTMNFAIIISSILFFFFIFSNISYAALRLYDHQDIMESASAIPFFQANSINKIIYKNGWSNQSEIENIMLSNKSSDINYPLSPLKTEEKSNPLNIIYILIDSWNFTTFDSNIVPNIYEFSKKGNYFPNHYTTSNATIASVFGMYYSLPYSYHPSFAKNKVYPVFFDRLHELNYEIALFSSAKLVLEDSVFASVLDNNKETKGNTSFNRDIAITENAIEFIDKQKKDKPFYMMMFYDLAHAISIPEEYRKQFQPSWKEPDYLALSNKMDATPFFNLYKNCLYFIDGQVKRVLDELKDRSMLDNTVVIITADHGQEFNESGKNNWGHFSNFSDYQIKVPFIFYYPGIQKDKKINHYTTHYDLVPTIMKRFLGVQNPSSDYALGVDLYDDTSRFPFWSGDFYTRTSIVFEDVLVTAEHERSLVTITNKHLDPMPNDMIKRKLPAIKKVSEALNKFYLN